MTTQSELRFEQLRENVHLALKQWHSSTEEGSVLSHLLLFRRAHQEGLNARQAANRVLLDGLDALQAADPQQAQLLRLRFLDNLPVYETANQLNLADSTVYVKQRQALAALAQLIFDAEQAAQRERIARFADRLEPPTYTQLFGVEEHINQLTGVLEDPGPPWIIALEGLGGIGKTTLADALLRRFIGGSSFANFGWVTARQVHFDLGGGMHSLEAPALSTANLVDSLLEQLTDDPAMFQALESERKLSILRERLKDERHLIVIDNLETLRDVESLLPTLRQFVQPSKFLLTSRLRYMIEPNLYHFTVPALSPPKALALVRQEAKVINQSELVTATDRELQPIYETVGGNPLALRLVVGLTHSHGLEDVLADLRDARGQTVENLYTYIYRRAWEQLDEQSKQVLAVMPLARVDGDSLDYIVQISQMERYAVRTALDVLAQQQLVNIHGNLNERRYSIHGLTRTFLQEQVLRWQ